MIVPVSIDDQDPRLAVYRQLKQSNLTRWSGLFIAEGDKVVERLLTSGLGVQSVLVGQQHVQRFAALTPEHVPLLVMDDRRIPELVGFEFHRGVLACGERPANAALESIVPLERERWRLVVCPNVQGPDNLGTILRTCAALGVDAVLLGRQSADPYSRRVLRVSMGELLRLPLRLSDNILGDLRELAERWSVQSVATVLDTEAQSLGEFKCPDRAAILFGGEGNGLPGELVGECHHRLTIPLSGSVDSLNVSIAAGIILYVVR